MNNFLCRYKRLKAISLLTSGRQNTKEANLQSTDFKPTHRKNGSDT